MVLDASDYRLPKPGSQYNPLSMNTYPRLVGAAIAVAMVGYAVLVGWRQGVPLVDQLVARITGGRVSASGEGVRTF